jgi:hypothetical protein
VADQVWQNIAERNAENTIEGIVSGYCNFIISRAIQWPIVLLSKPISNMPMGYYRLLGRSADVAISQALLEKLNALPTDSDIIACETTEKKEP